MSLKKYLYTESKKRDGVDSIVEKYVNERGGRGGNFVAALKKKFGSIENALKRFKKPRKARKPRTAMDKKAVKKLFPIFWKKKGKMLSEAFEEVDDAKMKVLLTHLVAEEGEDEDDLTEDDVSENSYGGYDWGSKEFNVLTDSEADDAAEEYIKETVWAFNYDFLRFFIDDDDLAREFDIQDSYYDEDLEEEVELDDFDESFYLQTGMSTDDMIKQIQGQYESGNDQLIRLIGDFDRFVSDAISSDGRGHFMSSYDGNEYEYQEDGEYYYVYRTN